MRSKTSRKKDQIRQAKRKRPLKYLILGLLVVLFYLFVPGDYGLFQYWRLYSEKKKLQQNIEKLKSEREQFKQEIELLSKDNNYIEKVAREKYKMGKKGEKIYLIVPSDKK